jgi:SAM-dependent methyltransferase
MPDAKFFPDEWFDVVECSSCGLGFVNPRPTPSEMGKYYPASYYDYLSPAEHLIRYERQAEFLAAARSAHTRPRLLDVGCANGDFPRFMARQGWDVEGVEVSSTTAPIEDFPVHTVGFSEAAIPRESFDAVTAWAVLEHVHDPMAYFRQASRVLRPGGIFAFLVTNFEAASSKHLFREDLPRHTYFYSERTVKRYLEATGLELVRVEHGRRIYEMLPTNWLRYFLLHRALGRPMTWRDLPEPPDRYFAARGLAPTLASKIRYVLTHPFTVLDRMAMPLYERATIVAGNYGIVTFVARKPQTGRRAA